VRVAWSPEVPVMQQMSDPPNEPLPPNGHLLQPILRWAQEQPRRTAAADRDDGRFIEISWKELHDRVWDVAPGLGASGVRRSTTPPGTRPTANTDVVVPAGLAKAADAHRGSEPSLGRIVVGIDASPNSRAALAWALREAAAQRRPRPGGSRLASAVRLRPVRRKGVADRTLRGGRFAGPG
jgi:hypothetical protein